MSRYDQPTNEPDYDRYEVKQDDVDVPDFDQPDPHGGCGGILSALCAIDPAEHAAHSMIEALSTLEKEIASTQDLERAHQLRTKLRRHLSDGDRVFFLASDKIDQILERRR